MNYVIWFTGISGSGKTTLANRLKDKFIAEGLKVEVLDGDSIREFFENDIGYSRLERINNIKRIALAGMLLARNGTTVIVSNIAPYYEVRDFIRRKMPHYIQIYLKASVKKCAERDIKGHYSRAGQGKITNMIGVDDAYDVPRNPDVILDTDNDSVDDCIRKVMDHLISRRICIGKALKEDFKVIVTLGPAIMNEGLLRQIYQQGPCIFRINGAHNDGDGIDKTIGFIKRAVPEARTMIDLPGNKIRLKNTGKPFILKKNELLDIDQGHLNYGDLYKNVKPGDTIFAQDSTLKLEVISVENKIVKLLSHSDGLLENNRGLHIKGVCHGLPFLFEKDIVLINAACRLGIDHIGLSYVRNAADIRCVKDKIREINLSKPNIIAKVETESAFENLESILREASDILIDRGDLSSEVGLQNLPLYQDAIINAARKLNNKVFLATQFLKNMQKHPIPLIAEAVDLYKTLKSDIQGIQLSEETAIGEYPLECVKYVFEAYNKIHGPLIRKE